VLVRAGFQDRGRHTHSWNWEGPGSTPVQFTDDPELKSALGRATVIELEQIPIRILAVEDLLHAKLRAAGDPARRRSKRVQDLADAIGLIEEHPTLERTLSPDEMTLINKA
jgi:hypothetical protein